MTSWIIRREAGGVEAVARIKPEGVAALLVFETAERAEKFKTEDNPRFRVFEVAELDEMGLAGVMVDHHLSVVAFVPEDEREDVDIFEIEEAL
jgi:hypothetical protein